MRNSGRPDDPVHPDASLAQENESSVLPSGAQPHERTGRAIRATARSDPRKFYCLSIESDTEACTPELMARMAGERPLQMNQNREPSPRALDDLWDTEPGHADLDRERGYTSDEDYPAPSSVVQETRRALAVSGSGQSSPVRAVHLSERALILTYLSPQFSAVTHSFGTSTSSRRGATTPSQQQSSPAPTMSATEGSTSTSCHSLLPPIPPNVLQLIQQAQAVQQLVPNPAALLQFSAPSANPSPSPTPLGVLLSGTSTETSIDSRLKRTSPDNNVDAATCKKAKKAERNAARPAHHKYRDDVQLSRVLNKAAVLLKVYFSTVNPFPSPRELENVVSKKFDAALTVEGLLPSTYKMSKDIFELVCLADSELLSYLNALICIVI